ncbi:MAG: hypothetical protein IT209_05335 [Armatimonadetes bacterium]|nr:hypothetical protein [Armatimonadota bacterium]
MELMEEEADELLPDDEDAVEDEDEEETEDTGDLIEIYSGPPYAANIVVNALKDRGINGVVQSESENSLIPPTEASVYITESDYNEYDDLVQECLELVEVDDDQGPGFGDDEE